MIAFLYQRSAIDTALRAYAREVTAFLQHLSCSESPAGARASEKCLQRRRDPIRTAPAFIGMLSALQTTTADG